MSSESLIIPAGDAALDVSTTDFVSAPSSGGVDIFSITWDTDFPELPALSPGLTVPGVLAPLLVEPASCGPLGAASEGVLVVLGVTKA